MKKLWLLLLPLSAQALELPRSAELPRIPRYELTAAQAGVVRREIGNKIAQPLQFAVAIPTDLRLTEGRWEDMDARTARWRLQLHSPDAQSLNLQLTDVRLPEDAKLWLYDLQGRVVQGPYTRRDLSHDGHLWTALVPGESAVLELQVARENVSKADLRIIEINHGYRPAIPLLTSGKSGSCNVDTACAEGDAWRDDIRAATRVTIGGRCVCSGQLVNNVRQDLTPYLITADHCGLSGRGSCAAPAASAVVYFNYQTSACGGTPDGSLSQNISGANLIASDARSDFTLLTLAQSPPPDFAVYYAGWNNGAGAPQSGVALHHPNGNEKRISVYTSPARSSSVVVDGTVIDAWQVNWSRGVTEQGSSGGGLWDQNHRLVGVLSGGDSSCDNPGGSDYFGRINAAWTANAASTGQLKAHLDPDNTGRTLLDGRDPARAAGPLPAENPSTPVTPAPNLDTPNGQGLLLGSGALDLTLLFSLFGLSALRRR